MAALSVGPVLEGRAAAAEARRSTRRADLLQALVALLCARTLLAAGTVVRGVVTPAVRAGCVKGRARLALRFDTLVDDGGEVGLRASGLDVTAESSSGRDKKIVAGAAVGVLAGGAPRVATNDQLAAGAEEQRLSGA